MDATGKLSGRGAYLCASAECFRRAVKEKRLSKALRTEVPDEVLEQIEKIISQGSEEM